MNAEVPKAARVQLRLGDISWLRAVAAIEVAFRHSDLIVKHFSGSTVTAWEFYSQVGAVGVEIFFVLSGYIMCARAASYRSGGEYLKARLIRIVPLYWVFTSAVLLAFLINPRWHLAGFELTPFMLIRSYLMLPQSGFPILGVGWTLEYEMVFYVAVACLAIGASGQARGARMALLAVVYAAGLAGVLLGSNNASPGSPSQQAVLHILSPYMLTFATGWLIRLVEDGGGLAQNWRIVSAFVVLYLLCLTQAPPEGVHMGMRVALAGGVVVLFRLAREQLQIDNAINRLGRLLGDASYSLYLSHWFVLSICGKALGSAQIPAVAAWPVRLLGIGLCLFVGVVVYSWIEAPIDRFLRSRLLSARRAPTSGPLVLTRST
jgi:exopolysaccharide production protein ExoZ